MISFADMDSSFLERGRAPLDRGSSPLSADDSEDLLFADDHVLDIVDLDLGADVLADEDTVARLDVKRNPLPVVVETARSNGDDLPLEGLLLGRVGDGDAALRLLLGLDSLDQDTVVECFTVVFIGMASACE